MKVLACIAAIFLAAAIVGAQNPTMLGHPDDYSRVDIEHGAGRIYLNVNPLEVILRAGEGIEWDFRYLGGADIVVEEMVIEFEKPSPFGQTTFRSRRPGAARPHRQLSGAAQKAATGKRVQYTIRAFNGFKMELANARPWVTIS